MALPDVDPPPRDELAQAARIRVALVITELDVGGAERALVRLACGLDAERFDVAVCSLAPLPSPPNALMHQLHRAQVRLDSIHASRPWQLAGARRRLRRWLTGFAPDVVQSFLFHANVLVAMARPADCQHVLGVRVADPRRWRQWAERRSARRAAGVVAVSEGVERHLLRHGFAADRMRTIPNGIDWAAWAEAPPIEAEKFGIGPERRVLLSVGRLDPQKNYEWLLEQAPRLLAQLPQHDLVILGNGPQRASLERWVHELAVPVHLLGWQPDVAGWLARSDLLLLTSRYEGMPNAILEAMAAGRAVVAADVEGVAELLGEAAATQVFPPGEATAFQRQVVRLATDEALRTACGQANQHRARSEYSTERMVARYAELYRELPRSPGQ